MRLRFTVDAIAHLDGIQRFISADSPTAAIRVANRLRQACKRVQQFPFIGRAGTEPDTREWVMPRLPYMVVYTVDEDRREVAILAILHAKRDQRH